MRIARLLLLDSTCRGLSDLGISAFCGAMFLYFMTGNLYVVGSSAASRLALVTGRNVRFVFVNDEEKVTREIRETRDFSGSPGKSVSSVDFAAPLISRLRLAGQLKGMGRVITFPFSLPLFLFTSRPVGEISAATFH